MKIDVLCIGIAAYDMVFPTTCYPAENSKIKVDTVYECGGGCAANAACLLAQWGVSTAFAGVVGRDRYGDMLVDDFLARDVDIRFLERRNNHPTPLSCILVNEQTGSRTIINRRQDAGPLVLPPESLDSIAPKVLLFDSHELAASLQAISAFPKASTILDAGTAREAAIELGSKVDYLVASQDFAVQYTGTDRVESDGECVEALAALRKLNPRTNVITLGERGAVHCSSDGALHRTSAIPVDAVDTTGAGDIFHGAFAYGVMRELPLEQCIELANRAAGLSVAKLGGRDSIPVLDEVISS